MVMQKEKLGKIIRARRKVLNLTIGELAEYTGLSRTTISDIELGNTHPRLDVINEILRFLNLEIQIVIKQNK